MKKTFISILLLAATLVLPACTTTSTIKHADGAVEQVTDFKASADSNARMYEVQGDVMWNAQEAVKKCYEKASTDVRIMACAMHGMSTNYSQAASGRPQPNRNPMSGTEANAEAVKTGVDGATKVGTAAVIGKAAADVANSIKPATPNVSNSYNSTTTTNTSTAVPTE